MLQTRSCVPFDSPEKWPPVKVTCIHYFRLHYFCSYAKFHNNLVCTKHLMRLLKHIGDHLFQSKRKFCWQQFPVRPDVNKHGFFSLTTIQHKTHKTNPTFSSLPCYPPVYRGYFTFMDGFVTFIAD